MIVRFRHRRTPTDAVELDNERAHSADLARRNAELVEQNRRLVQGQDRWRAEARRLSGDLVALKAAQRRGEK